VNTASETELAKSTTMVILDARLEERRIFMSTTYLCMDDDSQIEEPGTDGETGSANGVDVYLNLHRIARTDKCNHAAFADECSLFTDSQNRLVCGPFELVKLVMARTRKIRNAAALRFYSRQPERHVYASSRTCLSLEDALKVPVYRTVVDGFGAEYADVQAIVCLGPVDVFCQVVDESSAH